MLKHNTHDKGPKKINKSVYNVKGLKCSEERNVISQIL